MALASVSSMSQAPLSSLSTAAPAAPFASASLYVGDLQPDVTEALLFEIFNAVGPVQSVRVCRDANTRRSLGYAYVNFHRVDDAERALDTMNFKNIRNRPCRIMWSHRDPSLRKSGLGNIFVKNLAKSIDNKQLYDTFSMFGNILSCKVCVSESRESLGYGFVHYETDEAAQQAINRVDGKVIAGEKVSVQAFKGRKERGGNDKFKYTNIFVKNIPASMTSEELQKLFNKYGTITSSVVNVDKEDATRGFGFINFSTPEEATAAVEGAAELEVDDKKLFVARAQKKDEREKELRERFETMKLERQKKFIGVNLYVKNLSDDFDDAKFSTEFSKHGQITSAKIMRDPAGKSRGFGFVCYSTPEEATKAVTELNGKMADGKPLYVALAQQKESRRQQLETQYAQRAKLTGLGVGGGPQGLQGFGGPQGFHQAAAMQALYANAASGMPMPFPPQRGFLPYQAGGPMNAIQQGAMNALMSQQGQQPQGAYRGYPQMQQQQQRGGQPVNAMSQYELMNAAMQQQQQQAAQQAQQGNRGGTMSALQAAQQGVAQSLLQQQMQQRAQQQQNGPQQRGQPMPNGRQGQPQVTQMPGQGRPAIALPVGGAVNKVPTHMLAQQQQQRAFPGGRAPQAAEQVVMPLPSEPLTIKALAAAPEEMRKQMIGERLFPLIKMQEAQLAGKITGMLLEMDNGELIHLLESHQALQEKIQEALQVLSQHSDS